MHRRKRKRLLLFGLASGSIYMCVVVNLSWRQITNSSNVSSARRRNHPQELNDGSYDYSVMTTRLCTVPGPRKTNIADALSRMYQSNSKDLSSEKEDIVRFVATEATPVALTTREIERKSELDPELQSVRYYIEIGDWSKCKLMAYRCIKNELCALGKLVMQGDRTPGDCQDEESFKDKGVVAQDGQ